MAVASARIRAAAQAALARALLAKTAATLGERGIEFAPLKGVVLDALGREARGPRTMQDVDVLVDAASRGAAIEALRARRLVVRAETETATTLRDPELRMDLDLHVELFPVGLYDLRACGVLARSTVDERLLGTRVRLLHPLDQYAHIVGHFARSRCTATDTRRVGDFRVLSSAYVLDAAHVAAHLEAHGLARAARYSLDAPMRAGDVFARDVVRSLRADPMGVALAHVASPIARAFPGNDPRSVLVPHLVNTTLPKGAASLATHVTNAVHRRLREGTRAPGRTWVRRAP